MAILGISQADGVFVPIHHGQFPEQVMHILRDCGATALITDAARLKRLQPTLTGLEQLRLVAVDGGTAEDFEVGMPCHELELLCSETRLLDRSERSIGQDLAAILYTSGSTGQPKGVMLSHANILAGAEIVADYLDLSASDRILAALPMSFDAGLNQLTSSLLQGGVTVMINFRFGRDIVQALERDRVTGLAGVPSLWNLLTQPSSGLTHERAVHLRYVTNTGGAMPRRLLERLRQLLPATQIFLMYGLTEAFRSTYLPPEELDRRPSSMGKAIPNTEILVIDDEGQLCGPGEVGELVHHGPTVSMGYWGYPELTERVLRPHPFNLASRSAGQRVCYSGDLVRMDSDGYLYFVGRRDNQIKSAGFRISPTEVEEVICRHPAVRMAAVVGMPDLVLGQHLVAFAVLQEEWQAESTEIISHCAGNLPRHMVPKRVEWVSHLPLTSSGKVDYPSLRQGLEASIPSERQSD
jgi:acyl-CoA ligase (AMP-forming) (exosortase A-associated)